MKTTPKDFFLHLGLMVALYAIVISLLNLLFRVINVSFPQVLDTNFYYSSTISLQVAILIIVFPILVFLSVLVNRTYRREPEKRQIWVRRWLWMLTLFAAGLALVGDLVTLLYYFLDGREITSAFSLKVLSVLVVSAGVFGYILQDLKDKLTTAGRRAWLVLSVVVLIAAIVLGFMVIGSPRTQRLARYDEQRTNDLQNIQWQIVNYWQQKAVLPANLAALADSISGYRASVDPETGEAYTYRVTAARQFELCATFSLPSRQIGQGLMYGTKPFGPGGQFENWEHEAGPVCFAREIDPQLYPVNEKLRP